MNFVVSDITNNMSKFKKCIIRQEVSSRGGGVEIKLDSFGYKDQKMTAYQNYLGGGLLGSVQSDCTIPKEKRTQDLIDLSEELKKYFHNLTNPDSEWEGSSFEQNQTRPSSAY